MESEVGLHLVLRCGCDERLERLTNRCAARFVHARGRQCGRLAFDSEPEVDHVEDVAVGSDGRGLDGERRRLGHREHERAAALEGLDQALGAQPGHGFADDGPGHAVLLDELGLRGQFAAGWQVAGKDLVLQPGDDPLGQRRGHGQIIANSAVSLVSARIRSLRVTPSPGRSGSHIRPSRISTRSLKSGLSHSKCSTHGSVGYVAARCR
jgi:hypothetical protein